MGFQVKGLSALYGAAKGRPLGEPPGLLGQVRRRDACLHRRAAAFFEWPKDNTRIRSRRTNAEVEGSNNIPP